MKYICGRADGVSCVTEHYLQRRYFSTKAKHFTSHYSTLSLGPSFFTAPRVYPTHSPLNIAHVDLQIGLHSRKGTDKVILALEQLKLRGIIANVKFAGEDRCNNAEKIMEFAKLHNVEGEEGETVRIGDNIKISLFGESHGSVVGATIHGLESGIKIDSEFIKHQMNLRKANDNLSTSRHEEDDHSSGDGRGM